MVSKRVEVGKKQCVIMPWIRNNSTNVYTYIGTGSSHTQTVDNSEYSMKSGGVVLSDWINDLVRDLPISSEKSIVIRTVVGFNEICW